MGAAAAAPHCNTLKRQHNATHNNTMQKLQHTATKCNSTSMCAAAAATHCTTLHHLATHCNTLQHTATHCNSALMGAAAAAT